MGTTPTFPTPPYLFSYPGQGRPSWTVPAWRGAAHPVCLALTSLHLGLKDYFQRMWLLTGLQWFFHSNLCQKMEKWENVPVKIVIKHSDCQSVFSCLWKRLLCYFCECLCVCPLPFCRTEHQMVTMRTQMTVKTSSARTPPITAYGTALWVSTTAPGSEEE